MAVSYEGDESFRVFVVGVDRFELPPPSSSARSRRQCADMRGFVERNAKLSWILDDPRVTQLVEALLGADYQYISSVDNIFNSYISWHSDYFRSDVPPDARIKLAFYLDRLDASNGALRVIPGTNHAGTYRSSLFDEAGTVKPGRLEQIFGVSDDEFPCWVLDSEPGDLIVFDNAALHANFNGGPNRRMFVLQFGECRRPQPDPTT